jgi:hypothetical protein
MAEKKTPSTSPRGALLNLGQSERAADSSQPKPEDGRRLIDAFFKIKQPALREAIIRLVAELSMPEENDL